MSELDEHRQKMRQLNDVLTNRDWFTHMSDDHHVYLTGLEAEKLIMVLIQECGRDGERLYKAHHDIAFGPHNGFPYLYPEE